MDFVSADRSRDSEFQHELKNYNLGVSQINRDITKSIKTDRDTEKQQINDINSGETFTQIKDATGQATGIASATATFKNYQEYAGKIAEGVKKAQKTATDTAEKIQQAKPTTETPPDQTGGIETAEADKGGGALSNPEEASKLEQAGKDTATALKEGEETGSLIGRVGTKALKGLGVAGSVAGMGMAIASDANGGWAKMSTADKIGNVAEIGGAGLDIVGTVLEATPLAPLGLALQGIGTLAQLGSGIEGEIESKVEEPDAKKEAEKEEQQAEASDKAGIQQQEASVSQAQAGNLAVAREQQQ